MATKLPASLTECPICKDVLKKPKALPCLHTFCLNCLVQYEDSSEVTDDQLPCPLCRQKFSIPEDGLDKLKNNFFIEELISALTIEKSDVQTTKGYCVLCEELVAEKYCIDCGQDICNKCSQSHGRSTATKGHRIISQKEKLSSAFVVRSRISYCMKHDGEPLKLYCYDCKEVMCLLCYTQRHNTHKCADLRESSETFSGQLTTCYNKMSQLIHGCDGKQKECEFAKQHILKQVLDAEKCIMERSEELKAIIDKQTAEHMLALSNVKDERLKILKIRLDEIEMQRLKEETYSMFTEELITNGSPYDITLSGKELLTRCDEILKSHERLNNIKIPSDEISFTKSRNTSISECPVNLIGILKFNGENMPKLK